MEIIIGVPIEKEELKNCYKIHLNYMYGDADGYSDETFYVDEDYEYLEELITFLNSLSEAFPHGMAGYDTYGVDNTEYYWLFAEDYWLEDEDLDEEEKAKREKMLDNNSIVIDIPYERWNGGGHASFEGYEITYIDDVGNEFEVEIKLN